MVISSSACIPLPVLAADTQVSQASASTAIMVDPSIQYQTMDGWGTSLAWFANVIGGWSDTKRKEVENLLFGSDGLKMNILRYNIGGSGPDDPKKDSLRSGGYVESYETAPGVYDWTKDANQRKFLKEAVAQGVNITEAFSNSAPYWMTKSGSVLGSEDGSNNLKDDQYTAFADYLTEVVKHFKESEGITFNTLTPLNEPNANWWKLSGNQEGCHFDRDKQATIISDVYAKLADKGLTSTIVAAPEENSIDESVDSVKAYGSDVVSKIGQINAHSYNGAARSQLNDLSQSLEKPLWMSEYGTSGGTHGHDRIGSGLDLATQIFKDIKDMQSKAWIIWQAVEDEATMTKYNLNYGLIHAYLDGSSEEYYPTKQYYALEQFSKFITQGSTIIEADNKNVVAAYDKTSGKIVIVAKNANAKPMNYNFDLSKFNATGASVKRYRTSSTESCTQLSDLNITGSRFMDTVPENSVTTYVIDNAQYSGATGKYINDGAVGKGENLYNFSANWGATSQNGAYGNDNHYSNVKDASYSIKFKGNRIKIYGAKDLNSGIAGFSIDGANASQVDTYAPSRKEQSMLYDSGIISGAPDAEHTLTVSITGNKNENSSDCFINADKALVITGDTLTTPSYIPFINSLVAGDGRIIVNYSSVADDVYSDVYYNVKYGTASNDYNSVITNIYTNTCKIPNLTNSSTYYVSVSSSVYHKDSGNWTESPNSIEMYGTPISSGNSQTLYYVNCGDSSPTDLEAGESLGAYNSNEDQEYGMDQNTGFNWGYIADGNLTWSQDNEAAEGNTNYDTLRQYDGKDSSQAGVGKGLTYSFELPNGQYDVELGLKDPWGNTTRKENIKINNVLKTENLIPITAGVYKSYGQISVSDEKMDIRIEKAIAGGGNNPMISWIKISKAMTTKPQAPVINSISTSSSSMKIDMKESLGAESYTIKYGTASGNYTETINDISQSPYVISGLTPGQKYYVVCTAKNSYGESDPSAEMSAAIPLPPSAVYYVNCGDSSPSKVEAGEELGERNSVEEQGYGKDPGTGFNWGYIADDDSTWSQDKSDDKYDSLRQINESGAGKGLTYKFDIANGFYDISLGFKDPWNHPARKEDIIIQGAAKRTDYVPTDVANSIDYSGIEVKDGVLVIKIANSQDSTDNAMISWIKVVNHKDAVAEAPVINSVSTGSSYMTVKFNTSIGAKSYKIKYGTTSGNYTNTIDNVTGSACSITGLVPGQQYYVVVSAVNDYGESKNSTESSATTKIVSNSKLVYYVNCGDASADTTEADEETGSMNTVEDQTYGVDPILKNSWGYIADDNSSWSQDNEKNGNKYDCLRQYDGKGGKGSGLTYKFELPNGSYDVTLGFKDPWPGKRNEDILINGTTVLKDYLLTGDAADKAFENINVKDGILTIKVAKASDLSDKPMISWIKVEKYVSSGVVFDSNGGTSVASKTVSYNEKVTKPTDPTKEGYTFGGWYTDAALTTVYSFDAAVTVNITLYAKWDASGSNANNGNTNNGSSNTGNTGSVTNGNTETVNKTNSDPTKVETKVPELKVGIATTDVDASELTKALAEKSTASIDIPKVDGAVSYVAALPAAALASDNAAKRVKIDTEYGTVVAPTNMLNASQVAGAKSVELAIAKVDNSTLSADVKAQIGDRPVIDLGIKVDGTAIAWSNPNAPVAVSIPYKPSAAELVDSEHIVVWYINGDGNAIPVPTGRYDSTTGKVTFTTTHFSKYAIAYVHKTFDDINKYTWAKQAIEVMASKGAIHGISSSAYSPETAMKRADFVLLLVNALGLSAKVDDNFSDVKSTDYYYEAVGIAKKLGITSGSGANKFNPTANITRQDIMVLINNAMKVANKSLVSGKASDLNEFNDKDKISSYALESVSNLAKNGLVLGSSSKINPLENITRAETAVLIYRAVNK
jgi:uncharacterized repeat protein (TIGR02543 family)